MKLAHSLCRWLVVPILLLTFVIFKIEDEESRTILGIIQNLLFLTQLSAFVYLIVNGNKNE